MRHRRSRGVKGLVERHRVAFTFLALFLMTSPARPDDRQLLQANSGANTNVLLILDSSNSMAKEFSDTYPLPAFMDDFIYPEGTVANTNGSKLAIAKSVVRQVMTNTSGVNWAFSYYRNPNQTFGAANSQSGQPIGGAHVVGEHLENGGMEWLYFAESLYPTGSISTIFDPFLYPDVQQGRFLQMGHKPPHAYGTLGLPDAPGYTIPPSMADTRPPYPGPDPGVFRGAFGPHGLNEGVVVYRSPTNANHELRMQIVQGHYSDAFVVVQVDEYGPVAVPTPTPTDTPTVTNTPSNTPTQTASRTRTPTNTRTATNTASATRTPTFTGSATQTATRTATQTSTASATATPTTTFTASQTATPSNTNTPSATRTATNTATRTNTASATPTATVTSSATVTNTPSRTATRTSTFTASPTFTASQTNTPSNTPSRTQTFTPSPTFTRTNTASATFTPSRTNTPSNTATRTSTFTASPTFTASRTNTASNTPSRTNTASNTPTRTATNTASRTFTPSNTASRTPTFTATQTFTPSFTATQTFTASSPVTNTASSTATRTSTPSNTVTVTASNTATRTPTNTRTATFTASRTSTRTATNTPTRTFTASATPTGTPPPTATFTPTLVPTDSGGAFPRKSLLPAVANWLAPVVRGLLAMAPPPPPPPISGACPGIPASYTGGGQLKCAPCPYDPPLGAPGASKRTCAFVDTNGNGVIDPGEQSFVNASSGFPLPSSPFFMRGFDDPQADPDPALEIKQSVRLVYRRGDLYDLPPAFTSNDTSNGNPPWGSCPTTTAGCPASPDNDADAQVDTGFIADRHNQGMFAALYDADPNYILPGPPPVTVYGARPYTTYSLDAFAGKSCPISGPAGSGCDPYSQDCGGLAHFNTFKGFAGVAPTALGPPDAASPAVFPSSPPASPQDWPVVPFKREWLGTDYPGGNSPEASIKRLLRFTSSIVSYNSGVSADRAYTLEEDAKEVVATAPGTPLAGALLDAYNYFVNSVFPAPTGSAAPDPAIDCRNYIIVLLTDGNEECAADPCGGGPTGFGPSKDLGDVLLPESAPGRRAAANAADPSVRTHGVPVFVVGLDKDATTSTALNCIATNSGGQLFAATDRTTLQAALESILNFKQNATFFASPSVPAFSGGVGDTAQIGSVIPSHLNPNGELSSWSIWTGTIKSFQLDTNGQIPVVTGTPAATPTETPGGPTATPIVFTPTPTPTPPPGTNTYPDETNPDAADPAQRKPVWSAGRVLGYTDPRADLTAGASASAASPSGRAPAISVWPGRKMLFASGNSGVPLTRETFMPNSGGCTGFLNTDCFGGLMIDMGLDNTAAADRTRAILTVQFLRGGASTFGSRDEILNNASIKPSTITVAIGPNAGEEQKFSYFYQDDAPAPGDPPQTRTDDDGNPPAGYAHKLGDVFHSEPFMVEPPHYFQFLASNLIPRTSSSTTGEPYLTFAQRQAKRRKVLYVGANDGFLHAFDGAVWGRDTANFPTSFDLGTGREIFAYSPRQVMANKFPNLLNFPPLPQYFVDGSMGSADVFIDPAHSGTPTASERAWRTVLVGGLRQGGRGYFALDVTQPDDIDTNTASPTFGEIVGNKDASPGCLDGTGASCSAGAVSNRKFPSIMWELTDAGAPCSDGCSTVNPGLGESWSRPVVGRIKVFDPSSSTADASGFDDRYVAIFGGGFDPSFTPGDRVLQKLPKGRAIYVVDVETGQILFKTTEGGTPDGSGGFNTVPFAPMPSAPAVADYNDDGYLDVVYIGDVNGNMWRMSLVPDVPNGVGIMTSGQAHGYQPYLLFNGCGTTADLVCPNLQPIFFEPGIVFLGGGTTAPGLGIAFGTGNRADLARPNTQTQSFYYVVDSGQISQTFVRTDLHDLSTGTGTCPLPYDPVSCGSQNGFVLDYGSNNEKTTSTVFSTLGYLSLITYTPDSVSPCATNGSSYRYRFFFLTGQGGYGTTGSPNDYREFLSPNMASASQSTSPQGDTIDTVLFGTGAMRQEPTPRTLHPIEGNWKEQQ